MSTACALQRNELLMLETLTNESHTRDQALLALIASSWGLSSARSLLQYKLSVQAAVSVRKDQTVQTDQTDQLASSPASDMAESSTTARSSCHTSRQSNDARAGDGGIEQPQLEPEPMLFLSGERVITASSSDYTPRNPWNAFPEENGKVRSNKTAVGGVAQGRAGGPTTAESEEKFGCVVSLAESL